MIKLAEINAKKDAIELPEILNHAEPESDDTGLRESPVYANYVKNQWKAHVPPRRSRPNTGNKPFGKPI
jgi:hypothetical protein